MKKFWKEWGWVVLAGLGIFVIGFGLRIFHLTILPVFADEAIYIRWSQIMNSEPTLRFLPLSDGKQPLFMWILMFYVKRFSDPLFAGRLLSAVSGIGSMVGLFFLTYHIFRSKLAAIFAMILWALSPLSLFFDRMALVDAMLTSLGIWALYLSLITAESLRLDMAMITGFVLGLASLTKSPALFFAALIPVAVILLKKPKDLFKYMGLLAVIYFIAFGMYNIQRLGPGFGMLASRTQDYVFPLSRILTNSTDPIKYNLPVTFSWLYAMGPLGLMLLAAIGIIINFKKHRKYILILGAWFLAPLLFEAEYTKSFTLRYILFLVPPLYVFAAGAFSSLVGKWKYIMLLAFAIFIVQAGVFDWFLVTNPEKANFPWRERSGYFQEWTSGIGIKEAADYIRNKHNEDPNKKIVVGTEGYFGTLPDGFTMYVQDLPNIIVIGTGLWMTKIPEPLVESKLSGNLTYFIINKSRLAADPAKLNLTLIKSYPKEPRFPGTTEYAQEGPQDALLFFEVN
ncbi:MAG: glycosyltransferase family 39 protein [Candidatus Woesebacteria bacterium]|nr:glycosyltransferase family 39 protein [Candidatus Woesebacteria bacterium]